MIKSKRTQLELFFKSARFFRSVVLTISIVVPLLAFNALGIMGIATSFVFGTFLNSPSDVPGSLRRKVYGILISIVLTTLITVLILFTQQNFYSQLFLITVISFSISFLSAYGFRGSLLAFSGLLAMILASVVAKTTASEIWMHALYMCLGGLWYIFISVLFNKVIPKKDDDQLLSEVLHLTGEYLGIRSQLLMEDDDRAPIIKQTFALQSQISEKHETLRELLLASRKRSGRSHFDEKRLLIFIALVDIYELVIANNWDYEEFDGLFGKKSKHLEKFSQLTLAMCEQLIELSEIPLTNSPIPDIENIKTCLDEADKTIADFIAIYKLPQARKGALTLRILHDYQKQILQEIVAIRRALANITESSNTSYKRQDSHQFLTLQEYKPRILLQHLSLNSVIFRHALRLTIAIVFAFILGNILEIQNAYWIMLSVLVILRPNYGLTKGRAKDRIIGTLVGASLAFGIVLLTQNEIVFGVLAVITLILAFSLMQQNYRWAATFITLNIVFVYSFIHPDALSVIQYRVIDTIIGGIIAFTAIYILFPSWEVLNLKTVLLNAITKNNAYLNATRQYYQDKEEHQLAYKVERKEAFLAMSELSAAFQRITQEPKSKQKEFELIYDIVTLNQTILSGIAALGSFINSHKTTPMSSETRALFSKSTNNLSRTVLLLEPEYQFKVQPHGNIREAKERLREGYQVLSEERDANIEGGGLKINKSDLHQLQEAHLVINQLIWLVSLSSNLRKAIGRYVQHFEQK